MESEELIREEREARIAELESRLRRRSPVGVRAPVAVAAMLGAGFLLWMQRSDVAYLLSPREPISLGVEGEYRFELLRSNRYAQLHGVPTLRGAYAVEQGKTYVVVGLRETPVLVRREALPGEDWRPGTTPPRPNQSPFAVRGRLLAREEAGRYEDGFQKLEALGEVQPRWILIEGQRPGRDAAAAGWLGGLLGFIALNAWLFARDLRHRLALRRAARTDPG